MSAAFIYCKKYCPKILYQKEICQMKFFSCKLYVTTLQHCKILPAFCNLIRWQQVTFLSILFFARKRMKKLIDKGEE